ncbi:MAG: NrpR regulatory domain-containing protein [Candidatus Hydrothermarchaeota archaeon]|jgi:hypothetical protein|nr:NrpR regulatory domain-containing protein [Candidatus Hydrothermarchaeota archaeon]MDP6612420.1 NrpR regulatory domain-containing protein [Candidatus Hydrothermarchaeota archaeon]
MPDFEAERKQTEILRILSHAENPIGARIIARGLEKAGFFIGERGVRYYLHLLDDKGLTRNQGYLGRIITKKGREELENAAVFDRVGFIMSKIESLAYKTTFDLAKMDGEIIINLSYIDKNESDRALETIKKVFLAGLAVSPYVGILDEGEEVEGVVVPKGCIGLATACSITIDGLLLKAGIPTHPKYGGIVQVQKGKALRFTDVIAYRGSTLDPLEVFMARGMTSVNKVVKTGSGKILVNFREIPAVAREGAETLLEMLVEIGFSAVLEVGEVNRPLLSVPVEKGRVGVAIVGGINALAAIEELGVKTETKAISALMNIKQMRKIIG